MSEQINLLDIKNYGKKWLIIFVPFIICFFIIWPLGEFDEYIEIGSEFGELFTSFLISISAAGVFHFMIIFIPERINNKRSLILLLDHVYHLDKTLLEFLKKIDNSIENLEDIEKSNSSFFSLVKSFDFNKEIFLNNPNPNPFPFYCGQFIHEFKISLPRLELISQIFNISTSLITSEDLQNISNSIWNYNYLKNNELDQETKILTFLNTVEFYIKARKKIISLSNNYGLEFNSI